MSIGIGVIGAGVMGITHLSAIYGKTARAHVAAICDQDPSQTAAAAARVGNVRRFTDPTALIECDDVHAVVVASPDQTHFEYVSACIRALKPVLCEKPLAWTSAECRTLCELEAASGRALVQVGFMRRFDACYLELKAAYESGSIGQALIARCVHRNVQAPGFFRSGMAVTNAMVHEFDICRWLLGTEMTRMRIDRIPHSKGPAREDPLLASIETSAGQMVMIEVFMNAAYGYDIRAELVGDDGVLTMGYPPFAAMLSASGSSLRAPADFTARFSDAYRHQMQAWVDAIYGGRTAGAGSWDGLMATRIAEAGLESLGSGTWAEIDAGPSPILTHAETASEQ